MTILADTVDIVIGVDPDKHTHSAAVLAADTGKHRVSRTNPSRFAGLLAFAAEHRGSRCWVIGGHRSCGLGLSTWLIAHGEDARSAHRAGNLTGTPGLNEKDRLDRPRDDAIEVGVVKDNAGALPDEFETEPRKRRCRNHHNGPDNPTIHNMGAIVN